MTRTIVRDHPESCTRGPPTMNTLTQHTNHVARPPRGPPTTRPANRALPTAHRHFTTVVSYDSVPTDRAGESILAPIVTHPLSLLDIEAPLQKSAVVCATEQMRADPIAPPPRQ